ncbi:hypothetical protein [Croceicoccus marinus]|jgi:hypothetical protein|uniref:Uncharacterized protein n=1 Tax=Croceicoccus marinus TaxID=450378 RepID=A0A7G6VVV2_9SPHN|nr:hypothetical protein [Croceicoccus marinus]QNE05867.1 hypothetical protein H4O24_04150 [Croceicoccus marinus]
MDDLLIVAAVMAVPVLLVAELRRLLVSYFLNRSIQKALDTAPKHVESLAARLERPAPSAVSPVGLGAAIFGAGFLASLLFSESDIDPTEMAIGAGLVLFGIATLVSRWAATRRAGTRG